MGVAMYLLKNLFRFSDEYVFKQSELRAKTGKNSVQVRATRSVFLIFTQDSNFERVIATRLDYILLLRSLISREYSSNFYS